MIQRREFLTLLGGAAACPIAAQAQQPGIPIVGFVNGRAAEVSVRQAAAFRKGLNETGYVEGQNVTVEYHWLDGQYDRLPTLMAGGYPGDGRTERRCSGSYVRRDTFVTHSDMAIGLFLW